MGKSKRIFEEEYERERLEFLEEIPTELGDADRQALIEEYWRVHGKEPKQQTKKQDNDEN